MKLCASQQIPRQFLRSLPAGLKLVRKQQRDYLIAAFLTCVHRHSLISSDVRIHGEPSICLRISVGRSTGLVYIDAFWGGHVKLYDFIPDLTPDGELVAARCPTCGIDMLVDQACAETGCEARRAIELCLPGDANKIHICARLGCPGHSMDLARYARRVLARVDVIQFTEQQIGDLSLEV